MTFRECYEALEHKFKDRVEKDNEYFDELKEKKSSFLPNIAPQGPVNFVLIAMEPSAGGGPSKSGKAHASKNFSGSCEDFILHFCIKEYLCADEDTYYLTDLSKGAMPVGAAKPTSEERYKKWYPLLLDELELVAPDAPRIAIGNEVEQFLREQNLPKLAGKILHYSKQAAGARKKIPTADRKRYAEFSQTLYWEGIEQTIKRVTSEGEIAPCIEEGILQRLRQGSRLTESRKQLMFTYKVQFGCLRKGTGLA